MNGAEYRVRAQHPRRGGPLRITDKAGKFIAQSGDVCTHVPAETLASMVANDYVERIVAPEPVEDEPVAEPRRKGRV